MSSSRSRNHAASNRRREISPRANADAERYDTLDYLDVLTRDLRVMDASAVTLMRENRIPIVVFSIHNQGGLAQVLAGEGVCTVIGKVRSEETA